MTPPATEPVPEVKPEVKPEVTPEVKPEPVEVVTPEPVAPIAPVATIPQPAADEPIFKVQITANSTKLKKNAPQLKGLQNVDYYEDGGMYKYTVGSSADYQEIVKLRKELQDQFPQAFIVAFKGGKRCDVQQAIREYKQNRNKRR